MKKHEHIIRDSFKKDQAEKILALRETDREFFDILVKRMIRMKIIMETGNVKAFEKMKKQDKENFSCLLSELTLKASL